MSTSTNSFLTALNTESFRYYGLQSHNSTYTANGAKSNAFADETLKWEGMIGLFYKSVRGLDNSTLLTYLKKAIDETAIGAILLVFYIRDCRGGKGERDLARTCFNYLCSDVRTIPLMRKVLHELPEYGRWDDLVVLFNNQEFKKEIIHLLKNRLDQDLLLMNESKPISLLSKWMPTEKHAVDKKINFTKPFLQMLNMSPRQYRMLYLSPLRKHLDIVERNICAGLWGNIDFSKVPSCAMHKLAKAFAKHEPERFSEWKKGLEKGITKVNAGQLYPHEIVKTYLKSDTHDLLLEAQWKEIVKQTNELGVLSNSIVVCDVSGSMYNSGQNVQPIEVAISLGLLIAEVTKEPFSNNMITFSDTPEFVKVVGKDLVDRINTTKSIKWRMSTNIQSVFDLVLESSIRHRVPKCDMPSRIFIISDMQFNEACSNHTNYQVIKQKYNNAGYDMPQLVFWNVAARTNDYPVQITDGGTALISGFSPSILKYICETKVFTPIGVLQTVLNSDRYKRLRDLLEA